MQHKHVREFYGIYSRLHVQNQETFDIKTLFPSEGNHIIKIVMGIPNT